MKTTDRTLRNGLLALAIVCACFTGVAVLVAGTIAPPQQAQAALLNPSHVVHAAMADENKQVKPCQQSQDKQQQEAKKSATQTQPPVRDPLKILLRGILL